MPTLLDTLKKNLGQVGQPEAVADETGTVQQLLSARKGSGWAHYPLPLPSVRGA